MGNIHPKVASSTIGMLAWTAVCLALTQYLPQYAPNAELAAAVGTLVTALCGYYGPREGTSENKT